MGAELRPFAMWKACTIRNESLVAYPCFPVLYFFLLGSLPLTLVQFDYCGVIGAGATLLAGIVIGILIFPWRPRRWVGCAVMGCAITAWHGRLPSDHYINHLPRPEVYAEIQAVVTESRILEDEALAWLDKKQNIELQVTRIRLARHEPWQRCSGAILIPSPTIDLRYGAIIHGRGALVRPWVSEIPGAMNYRNFLRVYGIHHQFRLQSVNVVGADTHPWRRFSSALIRAREQALGEIISDLDHPKNQALLAAMILGFRHQLDRATRDIYVRSGTVHVLAISGLNIAILYTLLLPSLSALRLPLYGQYFLSPVLLLIYVVAAGAPPSAVRAWIMLTVWSVGKGLRLPVVPVNSVLFAALLLLVVNPYYIFDSGFQFSFAVVLCLVEGWRKGHLLVSYLGEKRLWIPRAYWGRLYYLDMFRTTACKFLISMTVAWAGSIGLTAYYNHLFLPGAIISNVLVCGIAWLIVFLSTVRLLIAMFSFAWCNSIIGVLLSWNVSALEQLSRIGAEYGAAMAIRPPSLPVTVAFYVGIFLVLRLPTTLRTIGCATAGYGLYFSVLLVSPPTAAVTIVVPESSLEPIILIQPPGDHERGILVGSGNRRFGYDVTSLLTTKGIGRLEQVILLHNRVSQFGGLQQALDRIPIDSLLVMATDTINEEEIASIGWKSGGRLRWYPSSESINMPNLTVSSDRDKDRNCVKLRFRFTHETIDCQMEAEADNELQLRMIRTHGADGRQEQKVWTFWHSSRMRIEEL